MGLSQGVQAHQANLYLDLVKKVNIIPRPRPSQEGKYYT